MKELVLLAPVAKNSQYIHCASVSVPVKVFARNPTGAPSMNPFTTPVVNVNAT